LFDTGPDDDDDDDDDDTIGVVVVMVERDMVAVGFASGD
jgi:hypothetical protein